MVNCPKEEDTPRQKYFNTFNTLCEWGKWPIFWTLAQRDNILSIFLYTASKYLCKDFVQQHTWLRATRAVFLALMWRGQCPIRRPFVQLEVVWWNSVEALSHNKSQILHIHVHITALIVRQVASGFDSAKVIMIYPSHHKIKLKQEIRVVHLYIEKIKSLTFFKPGEKEGKRETLLRQSKFSGNVRGKKSWHNQQQTVTSSTPS